MQVCVHYYSNNMAKIHKECLRFNRLLIAQHQQHVLYTQHHVNTLYAITTEVVGGDHLSNANQKHFTKPMHQEACDCNNYKTICIFYPAYQE